MRRRLDTPVSCTPTTPLRPEPDRGADQASARERSLSPRFSHCFRNRVGCPREVPLASSRKDTGSDAPGPMLWTIAEHQFLSFKTEIFTLVLLTPGVTVR